MVLFLGDLEVVEGPLPFKVYVKTRDKEWTLKAAFATDRIAGAWLLGAMITSQGRMEGKIAEDRDGELFEITEEALKKTQAELERLNLKNPDAS